MAEDFESKFEHAMKNVERRTTKYKNYFPLYDRIISQLPSNPCLLEIGIANGGSLETWRELFPEPSRIVGVDLNPRVTELRAEGFEVYVLDTGTTEAWEILTENLEGKVDLLVDDGGHTNRQQIMTIIHGINLVRPGGWIVIEDLHASVMQEFGNPGRYSTSSFLSELNLDLHRLHQRSGERPRFPSVSNRVELIIQSCSWAALRISETKVGTDFEEVSYGFDDSLMDFDHRWDSIAAPRKLKQLVPKPVWTLVRTLVLKASDFFSVRPLIKSIRD